MTGACAASGARRPDPVFAARFAALSAFVASSVRGGEILFAALRAERSDYVRFNGARVRQAGAVERSVATLRLIDRGRQARIACTLGEPAAIEAVLAEGLATLRTALAPLPPDPHACWQALPAASQCLRDGSVAGPGAVIDAVVDAAGADDLVGVYAGGVLVRALASSLGHRHYHESLSCGLDFSLQLGGDRAVKENWSAEHWDAAALRAAVGAARERVQAMRRPSRRLAAGEQRVLLAPRALAALVSLLGWGGFSERAWRTGQSPLARALRGEASLHADFDLVDDCDALGVPRFQDDGFERPARLPLIARGRPARRLVSPRSAREFGVADTGADDDERPFAPCVSPGRLPDAQALSALDTGVAISDLWYLNYSDRDACRVTGMTRFATLWVERGVPVAPIEPMRFDDSLYRVLGERLASLTDVARRMPVTETWDGREPGGVRAPAALVEGLRFTL